MDARHVRLVVDLDRLGLEPVEAVELVRPGDSVRSDVPLPAPDVGELLRLREACVRPLEPPLGLSALGEDGAEDEEADGNTRSKRFEDLDDLGRAAAAERGRPVNGSGDRQCPDDEAARHGAELPEAQDGPDQGWEEKVRVPPLPAEKDDRADGDEHDEEHEALEQRAVDEAAPRARRENEDQRGDEEGAHCVSDPPEEPVGAVVPLTSPEIQSVVTPFVAAITVLPTPRAG